MAENKSIVIEVIGVDGDNATNGGGTSKVIKEEDGTINLSKSLSPLNTDEQKSILKTVFTMSQLKQYAKTALSVVDYSITRNFSLKEDYISQQTYSNVKSVVNHVTSIGKSILAGAAIGSKAGPIGAAIGAAAAVEYAIVTTAIGEFQRYDQAYIQLNESNYESTFQKTRLGLIDNGRGTLN